MKKTLLAFVCGSALITMTSVVNAAEDTLTVGTEGDAPPYSMADVNGNVTGYDADIANAVCSEMKVKCRFVVQSFSTLIPSLSTDRFDVIVSGLGITEARKKQIDYSIPYGGVPQYYAIAKDSPIAALESITEIEKQLDGKTVGVVNGTTYAKYVQKHLPKSEVKTYDATTQMLADLEAGRIDSAYSDSPTWTDFFKTPGGSKFTRVKVAVRQADDPTVLGYGMGVGIRKGNTALQAKVDTALCALSKKGELTAISKKWFDEDYAIACQQ
jgi:octopine/nopaline transport system substrate-binding protein